MPPISDDFSLDYLLQTPDLISARDSGLAGGKEKLESITFCC